MNALFALGNRASAEAIRERLINPPSYSAVRAMLVRLEKKGHIRHHTEGPRYIYSATTSPAKPTAAKGRRMSDQNACYFARTSSNRTVLSNSPTVSRPDCGSYWLWPGLRR